jgi:serine/threonine-protein kinase
LRLGTRIFLASSLLILVAVGAAGLLTFGLSSRIAGETLEQRLERSAEIRALEEGQRYDRQQLAANLFVADADMVTYIEESSAQGSTASILDILIERQPDLGFDFALVTDPDGVVLARTDRPDDAGADAYDNALVAKAVEEYRAAGVWSEQGGLFYTVAVPLARGLDLFGYFVTAYQITDEAARQTRLLSDAHITVLRSAGDGFAVVCSSLDETQRRALRVALVDHSDAVHRVLEEGASISDLELSVDGDRWIGYLSPILDAAGEPVGATVATESMALVLAPYRRIGLALAGSGLLAFLIVSGLTYAMTTGALRPIRSLVEATKAARAGRYDQPLPSGRSDEVGELATAFQDLLEELRERHDMELYVAALQRNIPDKSTAASAPTLEQTFETNEMSLLGFDFRRHARVVVDAMATVGELGQDVERVRQSVRLFQGRVVAQAGHRVWAAFDGFAHGQRALGAAAAMFESQSAAGLDDTGMPAAVIAAGVVGRGALSGQVSQLAIAGRPVAELESLMREAAPGEILLTQAAAQPLIAVARERRVSITERKGMATPLRFVTIDPVGARRIAQGLDRSTMSEQRRAVTVAVRLGDTFGDRYEILGELGAGGMGVVYKARDLELDDVVALKVLRAQAWDDPKVVERIKQELKLSRMITHPNVIRVYDFGDIDGTPFISMEYVYGITLRQLLDGTERVPYAAGLRLARQICRGLEAVHQAGVVHCDLKPENIILEPTGNARLMDFGIAQAQRVGRDEGGTKVLMGTPRYLAPEQIDGRGADRRSDIYAVGVVLYELFTGAYPYTRGKTLVELLRYIREDEPFPPAQQWPEIPPKLADVLLRCLRKDPDKRYQSLAELLVDIESLVPRRSGAVLPPSAVAGR